MKSVEHFRWWLPARTPRGKPKLSRWLMDAEQAAAQGAIRPEPSTRVVREIPETEDEIAARRLERSDRVSRPRWLKPEVIELRVLEKRQLDDAPRPDLLALRVREVRWLDDYWAPAARPA